MADPGVGSDRGTSVSLDEDGRYALAAGAQAAARRNTPRWMVRLSALVFAVAGIALIVGLTRQRSAQESADAMRASIQQVRAAVAEIERLDAQADDGGPTLVGDRLANLLSTMESLARRAGIEDRLPTPRERAGDSAEGAVAKRYDYTLQSPTLEPLLRFVELATERIDAMQVYSVRVRIARGSRGVDVWEMNVVFQRWEKTEG